MSAISRKWQIAQFIQDDAIKTRPLACQTAAFAGLFFLFQQIRDIYHIEKSDFFCLTKDKPMAVARCVFPVPEPPTKYMLS